MNILTKCKTEVFSDESTIWRYMDFSKFVDMLDSSCLFLPGLTILKNIDPYEGSLVPFDPNYKNGESSEIVRESNEEISDNIFVSCWHINDVESAALWKLYSRSNEVIAIRSEVSKLVSAIEHPDQYHNASIILTAVEYGHEKVRNKYKDNFNGISGDDIVFTKRRCFEHERELRLAIYNDGSSLPLSPDKTGLLLKVNLEDMLSEVIISPEAPLWILDLVKRVTQKYGFSYKIRQSTLNKLTF